MFSSNKGADSLKCMPIVDGRDVFHSAGRENGRIPDEAARFGGKNGDSCDGWFAAHSEKIRLAKSSFCILTVVLYVEYV